MKINIELDITKEVEQFNDSIAAWKDNGEGDINLKKVYAQDRKDLREVLRCLKKGYLKTAYDRASFLDSIVRGQIPDSVWKILEYNH